MNSGMIAAKSAWTSHTFEFLPGDVDGTGTLHFRFPHEPGEIWLADLRIRDAKTSEDVLPPGSFATPEGFAKRWNFWPVGPEQNTGEWFYLNLRARTAERLRPGHPGRLSGSGSVARLPAGEYGGAADRG